jgi:O-antigen/teichoic acid export membrane protein
MSSSVGRDLRRGALAGTGSLAVGVLAGVISVPIVLHGLGPSLYGVWVVASVVILSQGLFDLGAVAAMTRYIAIAAPRGDRVLIRGVVRLAVALYTMISLVVLVAIAVFAAPIADALGVGAGNQGDAVLLLLAGGVSFGLSNAQAVLVGFLTGLNHADTAYQSVAAGYVVFIAVMVVGAATGHTLAAVVAAGPVLYGTQCLLMIRPLRSALRQLPEPTGTPEGARLRELLPYGLGMQTAAIADFCALQLPRLIGALAFGASAIVGVDVAVRAASVVAGVLLMTQTAVLPALARAWVGAPETDYIRLARRTFGLMVLGGTIIFLLLVAALGPAIRVWVGDHAGGEASALAVAAAFLVHSLSAPLTAAAQARGMVRPIVIFKLGVLLALIPALLIAAQIDPEALIWATALAVFVPSAVFCVAELRGPLGGDEPLGIEAGHVIPFVLAAAAACAMRTVLSLGDLATLGVVLVPFAFAAAWVLRRSPPSLGVPLPASEMVRT